MFDNQVNLNRTFDGLADFEVLALWERDRRANRAA
jgi:hypothetical protein